MVKHYLKQTFRNFRAAKLIFGGSIITVFLGVLSISLLFTYVYNELSMDNFHHREKDIYMTVIRTSPESQWKGIEATSFFKFNYKEYPELENLVSLVKYKEGEVQFTFKESSFSPEGIIADSSLFRVFDFKLKVGDEKTVLSDPDAAILSEQLAKKMFGKENPIGKIIKVSANREKIFTVKGILANMPSNSSISFDFILPKHSASFDRMGVDFLLAKQGFDKNAFIKKIETIGHKHSQFTKSQMSLVALDDVYFTGKSSDFNNIFSHFGNKKSLNVLYIIMGILFVISALNFSNLQVININASIKNMGINKISGARGYHIFYQKVTEVLLLICISALLITGVYIAILPYFNIISGVMLSPHPLMVLFINVVILVVLMALAMIYPTFIFSRIPITLSLKNQIFSTNKLVGRQAIVTIQFTLSIFLLIASVVVVKQLNMMLDKDLGFSSSNNIKTRFFYEIPRTDIREERMKRRAEQQKNFQYVKNELASHSSVNSYSQGLSPITPFTMAWKLKDGDKDYTTEKGLIVTPDYLKLFGLNLVEGRFFEYGKDKERGKTIVINEAAKRYWGINDISKARILNKSWEPVEGYEIIGVVKDFNFEHLSVKPQPLIMLYFEDIENEFFIKFNVGSTQTGLLFIQQLFKKFNPGATFQYSFLSDEIEALYQKEKRLSQIYIFFTLIAFLISATGLFTIALYDTHKRTKEIGIRKVNGARVSEILTMLNKDFIKLVAIAFVIAIPIVYYAMNKWLENFAYKTDLSWWIFALAGLLAFIIALITVSWQSWKAATRNPVEALKYE